jgi:uncharacterized membrane protein YsdA (DUF1294 family)
LVWVGVLQAEKSTRHKSKRNIFFILICLGGERPTRTNEV